MALCEHASQNLLGMDDDVESEWTAPLSQKSRSSSFHDLVAEASSDQGAKNLSLHHYEIQESNYIRFRGKMHSKVCELLRPSDDDEDDTRTERLKMLFNDLTSKLEPEISLQLKHPTEKQLPLRYYLILAEYYAAEPQKAVELQLLSVSVWNNSHFQLIYSLLMYRWLFQHGFHEENGAAKWLAVFIKGAYSLFWLDVENSTRRFSHIWRFLCNNVFLAENLWFGLLEKKIEEIWNLVAVFYLYYGDATQMIEFLTISQSMFDKHIQAIERPPNHFKINAVNMFVNENIRTLAAMKNEVVLIKYLTDIRIFTGKAAIQGRKTRTRLSAILMDLATPGYPLYPTREVKEVAQQTMDILFPAGRFWRKMIHLSFRFLRPLSFVHWIQLRMSQLFTYCALMITSLLSAFGMKYGRPQITATKEFEVSSSGGPTRTGRPDNTHLASTGSSMTARATRAMKSLFRSASQPKDSE